MKKRVDKKRTREKGSLGSVFAAGIPLLGFVLFGIIPLVLATVVSLSELHSTDLSDMSFVGLKNFITILTNNDEGRTYASYLSTVIYALNGPICIALALYIANLVNNTSFGQRFFRSVFFIPYVCSTIAIGLVFKILYNDEMGVLNAILSALGFEKVHWLTSTPLMFLGSTIIMTVWKGLGYCIVLFQAALANVDKSYYEAAKIDGATPSQIFWKITWPAISPTTAYLLTMKIIWALQSMSETYILAGGSNTIVPTWNGSEAWASDLVVKHIYNMVFLSPSKFGYGLGSAAGWILAIIIFIITRVNMKLQKRWVSYDF